MIPNTKLFGDNHQVVLSGNKQIYMEDSVNKKFPCISFFWVSFTSQEVLNKDPAVWLDRVKPPKNLFASI
jgi:hypothetical protein